MINRVTEKGQIIVILALGMVAMIAITALAVDGSLLYNQRRQDQSTSDSAALAGGGAAAQALKDVSYSGFRCGTSTVNQAANAAVDAAVSTALVEDDVRLARYDLSTNGVDVTCVDTTLYKYLDVHVVVTSEPETTFARVISIDTLKTSVTSVVRVYPKQPYVPGVAIYSTGRNCERSEYSTAGGIGFNGAATSLITGGGVFSNSCITAASDPPVSVSGGEIDYMLPVMPDCRSLLNMTPTCGPGENFLPEELVPAPECANTPFVDAPTSGEIGPGNYRNGIIVGTKKTLTLRPGLYCIQGGEQGALRNNEQSILEGTNVTLYILSGDVTINQNDTGSVNLSAAADCDASPYCGGTGEPQAIEGLLMYVSPTYTAAIKLNGGSTNNFTGTIYAPKAIVTLNGGSTTSMFRTQVIGQRVDLIGNAEIDLSYEEGYVVARPSSLSLIR